MKPINFLTFLSLFLLLAPSSGNAAGSMLRISCDGDDVGAEVMINGKFRGECPIDLQVPEGALKLLVRKKLAGGHERVFELEIRMGEGSVKKVEARLGAAKLDADEAERQAENLRRLGTMTLAGIQKEAEAGNTEAMMWMAFNYYNGSNGALKSDEKAVTWFRKAAEAGNARGMYMLSSQLSEGKGVAIDINGADVWLRNAAEGGFESAMKELASNADRSGNYEETLKWYRRLAEQGNAEGLYWVGSFYHDGKGGVPKNSEEAVAWWRKAADAGGTVGIPGLYGTYAMYKLGCSYENGEGVAASHEQAINWWRKAAEGERPNKQAVDELKKRGLR
jgi:TPR repeat protein